ncbi:hypothetical protein SASPL_136390 [Salvia splendens]|uniref:Bidirectional sugar transporter SWEET n=1 Tax=Salvia splendens TaxID=180675 RepID=A0A8X8X1K9_SALSN|nr:bidirectional sugar transporter SWEET12-like [Salvia splendens]KAG6404150.1 hypothetical protein SASPL_136390 [Salvia splendens]
MMSYLDLIFGLLGNFVSLMVFLAPVPTFIQIYKKKSTEGFQSVPYVVGLFSAMLWIYYALLKTDTTLLITINSVGCFVHTAYISFYLCYAPKSARLQTGMLILLLNIIGMSLIVVLTYFLADGSTRGNIVGWICLIFSLCVFVAPLFILRQVIRTKSVEYMPFLLSLFLTISAVMWFFYGLLRKDYNIAIPNVVGFTFGVIQMVLYVIYKGAKKAMEERLPEIQVDAQKNSEIREQIIDAVTLSALVCPEIVPALPQLVRRDNFDLQNEINIATST